MSLVLALPVLHSARADLLRHDLAISEVTVPPPDNGASSELTRTGLERAVRDAQAVAGSVHGLAEAVEEVVRRSLATDGRVAALLDVLLAGTLR